MRDKLRGPIYSASLARFLFVYHPMNHFVPWNSRSMDVDVLGARMQSKVDDDLQHGAEIFYFSNHWRSISSYIYFIILEVANTGAH